MKPYCQKSDILSARNAGVNSSHCVEPFIFTLQAYSSSLYFSIHLNKAIANLSALRTCTEVQLDKEPHNSYQKKSHFTDTGFCAFCRSYARATYERQRIASSYGTLEIMSDIHDFVGKHCTICGIFFCEKCYYGPCEVCPLCCSDDLGTNQLTANQRFVLSSRAFNSNKKNFQEPTKCYNWVFRDRDHFDSLDVHRLFSLQRDTLLSASYYSNAQFTPTSSSGVNYECKKLTETQDDRLVIASDGHAGSSRIQLLNQTSSYTRVTDHLDEQDSVEGKLKGKSYSGAKWFTLLKRSEVLCFLLSAPPFCRHFYVCPDPLLPADLVLDIDEEIQLDDTFSGRNLDIIKLFFEPTVALGSCHDDYSRISAPIYALIVLFKILVVIEASYRYVFNECIGSSVLLSGCRYKDSSYKVSFHAHIRPGKNESAFFQNMQKVGQFVSFIKSFPDTLQEHVHVVLQKALHDIKTHGECHEKISNEILKPTFIQQEDLRCIDAAIYRPWQPLRLPYCSKRADRQHFSAYDHLTTENFLRFFPEPGEALSSAIPSDVLRNLFRFWEGKFNSLKEDACFDRCLITRDFSGTSSGSISQKSMVLESVYLDNYFPQNIAASQPVAKKARKLPESTAGDPLNALMHEPDCGVDNIHPIEPSKVYTSGSAFSKNLFRENNLFLAVAQLIQSLHDSFNDKNLRKLLNVSFKISMEGCPFLYVTQNISKFCLRLQRKHAGTFGKFKIFLDRERATEIIQKSFNFPERSILEKFHLKDRSEMCKDLGIQAVYFLCWSNDCNGDAMFLKDLTH